MGEAGAEHEQARNEVLLVGRVAAPAEERELPSGDVIMTWRLIVTRPVTKRPRADAGRSPTVDTLDCVAWAPAVQRTAGSLVAGEVVTVEGALRRRFWRAGAGAASRCEVEVSRVRRGGSASPRSGSGASAKAGKPPGEPKTVRAAATRGESVVSSVRAAVAPRQASR